MFSKAVLVVAVLLFWCICSGTASTSPLQESIEAQLEELELEELLRFSELVEPDFQVYLPRLDLEGILGAAAATSPPESFSGSCWNSCCER